MHLSKPLASNFFFLKILDPLISLLSANTLCSSWNSCNCGKMGYIDIHRSSLMMCATTLMLSVLSGVIGNDIYLEWKVSLDPTIRPINVNQPVWTETFISMKKPICKGICSLHFFRVWFFRRMLKDIDAMAFPMELQMQYVLFVGNLYSNPVTWKVTNDL